MKTKIIILLSSIFLLSCSQTNINTTKYIGETSSWEAVTSSNLIWTWWNTKITDFNTSKKVFKKIFSNGGTEIYCWCKFNASMQIDKSTCNYTWINNTKRSSSVEYEHVVVAQRIWEYYNTWSKTCWKTNRECSFGNNKSKYALVDMYNLMPAIWDLNLKRSNYPYWEVSKKIKTNGCEFYKEVQKSGKKTIKTIIEPSDNVKWRVARASLYMNKVYWIPLSKEELNMFLKWNNLFKANKEECEIWKSIAKYQWNVNPFLIESCKNIK